jgi:hypothetical protein
VPVVNVMSCLSVAANVSTVGTLGLTVVKLAHQKK